MVRETRTTAKESAMVRVSRTRLMLIPKSCFQLSQVFNCFATQWYSPFFFWDLDYLLPSLKETGYIKPGDLQVLQ